MGVNLFLYMKQFSNCVVEFIKAICYHYLMQNDLFD